MSKLVAVQSKGKVAKAMKITERVTALSATPDTRTSQPTRYNAKSNRYLSNVAIENEGDEQLRGEGEETGIGRRKEKNTIRIASRVETQTLPSHEPIATAGEA